MFILVAATLFLVAATFIAQVYFRDSARDHKRAHSVWDKVYSNANRILEGEYPEEVRRMAMGLTMTTGCGCYIRSVLIEHYTPSLHRSRVEANRGSRSSLRVREALSSLSTAQRKQFDQLVGAAIAFDAFTNPLQGWLFRRAMAKRFAEQAPVPAVPSPSRAEREAVLRTVVRKKPELCAA